MKNTTQPHIDNAIERFAKRLTTRLDEGLAALPYEVLERLRASRVQAVALRKRPQVVVGTQTATAWSRFGSVLAMGGGNGARGWWVALMSGIPVLAIVAGIMVVGSAQDESMTNEVAEVDAALLADALPPAAYADPGFAQFLKTRTEERN